MVLEAVAPRRLHRPARRERRVCGRLSVLTITLAVHIPINQRILADRLEVPELRPLLDRWATFHALRTLLALSLPYAIVRFLRKASAPAA